jgi:hypothetical protein
VIRGGALSVGMTGLLLVAGCGGGGPHVQTSALEHFLRDPPFGKGGTVHCTTDSPDGIGEWSCSIHGATGFKPPYRPRHLSGTERVHVRQDGYIQASGPFALFAFVQLNSDGSFAQTGTAKHTVGPSVTDNLPATTTSP